MDYTILVNKEHLLSSDYVPEGLVEIHEPMGSKLDKTYINRLNAEAYKAFKEMQKEALKEGYEIFVSPATDIAFVKYYTGESYMIFCID